MTAVETADMLAPDVEAYTAVKVWLEEGVAAAGPVAISYQ